MSGASTPPSSAFPVTLFASLLGGIALVLLARYVPSLAEFGRWHLAILLVNVSTAAVLLGLILVNLSSLVRAYRRREPGARLRARLVGLFVGLTLAPLLVVYFFALQFVSGGIDSWFSANLEQELSSALRLSQESLEREAGTRLKATEAMAKNLGSLDGASLARVLSLMRVDEGADELSVFSQELAVSGSSTLYGTLPPTLPDDALTQLTRNRSFVALEPLGGGRYGIRAAVLLSPDQTGPERGQRYLQAVFPVDDRQGRLADAVEDTYTRYTELRFLRKPLKTNLTLTLSLVLMLALLSAVAGAFYLARRLVSPIALLAQGTAAVAAGDFDTRLPHDAAGDEIGLLIRSFNAMSERLAWARQDSLSSQQQLESERAKLATILGRLSTGVIAIDPEQRIRMANDAAGAILGADLTCHGGLTLDDLAKASPLSAQLVAEYRNHRVSGQPEWRGQIELHTETSRRTLNCATSPLPPEQEFTEIGSLDSGAVLVFEDVTDLLLAQREAAWGEVARRLAHEIKNPLTPIRLAAERIRRRYLPSMEEEEGSVLERSTHTIVQQVEAMRDMVNSFSEYARGPKVALAHLDLSQLVREVAWLYRNPEDQPRVELAIEEHLYLNGDGVLLRQLLHNLIRNAKEALEGQVGGVLEIRALRLADPHEPRIEIAVTDNGPGIDVEILDRLFEPYVTTKKKGMGLGLAIGKKLVDDHGGTILAENLPGRGARLRVLLPLASGSQEGQGIRTPDWRGKV